MGQAHDCVIEVAPDARENYRAAFRDGDELLARFGITTRLRLAHFLAQVLHESGDGKVLFENLSYSSPGRLMETLADKNDIRRITRRINGGYNGIADRQETFDRLWALLGRGDTPAWKASAADPDTT